MVFRGAIGWLQGDHRRHREAGREARRAHRRLRRGKMAQEAAGLVVVFVVGDGIVIVMVVVAILSITCLVFACVLHVRCVWLVFAVVCRHFVSFFFRYVCLATQIYGVSFLVFCLFSAFVCLFDWRFFLFCFLFSF